MTSKVNGSTVTRTQHRAVVWTKDGQQHQATVDFPGGADRAGTTQQLLVDGDDAIAASGRFFGLLAAGFGLVLGVIGALLRQGTRP